MALLRRELKLASMLLAAAPAEEVRLLASEARLEVMLPRSDSTDERTEERAVLDAMAEPATEVRELMSDKREEARSDWARVRAGRARARRVEGRMVVGVEVVVIFEGGLGWMWRSSSRTFEEKFVDSQVVQDCMRRSVVLEAREDLEAQAAGQGARDCRILCNGRHPPGRHPPFSKPPSLALWPRLKLGRRRHRHERVWKAVKSVLHRL